MAKSIFQLFGFKLIACLVRIFFRKLPSAWRAIGNCGIQTARSQGMIERIGWILGLLILSGVVSIANATEEPAWTLVHTWGDVEVRHYEPVAQARTMTSENAGFRTLARYISGGNKPAQEISMTAPVERSLSSETNYMAFYMPEKMTLESLPQPNDNSVTLHEIAARTVAVMRFSGRATNESVQENVQALLASLASRGIEPLGEVTLAQYNPPWTLPWNRRNEVMVEIPARN